MPRYAEDAPEVGKVGEVGQGMPEVGFEVVEVGVEDNWKHYMYKPVGDWAPTPTPVPPSAWTSIRATFAGYARELWDAARWFFALPLRALPDVAGPAAPAPLRDVPPLDSFQPAPAADVPAPADVPPAEIPAARPKTKRKPRRRKD